jgi:hypothetical protein
LIALDFRGVTLLAFFIGPFARTDAAFNVNLRPFFQVLAADFGQLAEEGNAVPLGQFLFLAGCLVFPALAGRHGDIAHCFAARGVANFRVFTQVPDDDCLID